ncbi:MAG TPA: alginate export family protein, partial [Sphingobium sp.]
MTKRSALRAIGQMPVMSLAAMALAVPAMAQNRAVEVVPGGQTGPQGVPQTNRWTENWSAQPADDAPLLEKIRHIPIGDGGSYLSIGGEARAYYTDWKHSTLGLRAGDDNDPVATRLRLLADLHVGENLRAYVELGDNREFGEQFGTVNNRDKLDIYQAFVDVTLPLGKAGRITVRPGRFEMPLGNAKLVGMREGLNMRFTYQGVRATYILPGKLTVDAFALRPVAIKPDRMDDGPNHAVKFHGVYLSTPQSLFGFGVDAYWYAVERDRAVLSFGTGRDVRNNWGGRLWKKGARWDVDLEGNVQTGSFIDRDIAAYAILFEGGYTVPTAPLKPRFGLKANLFSGDRNAADGKAGTFVSASPRLPLISEAAFFNLSNLMDLYPSVTVKPHKAVTVMVGPDFLWRHRRGDGVYIGPSGASFAPYASGRYIGTDLNLEAAWQVSKRLSLRLYETYFLAGDGFAQRGGRDGNYLGVMST